MRLGETLPLHYQWYYQGRPRGETIKLSFEHGDFYVMSEKSCGFDWLDKSKPTLRHAAGADKFLELKEQ